MRRVGSKPIPINGKGILQNLARLEPALDQRAGRICTVQGYAFLPSPMPKRNHTTYTAPLPPTGTPRKCFFAGFGVCFSIFKNGDFT